MRRYFFDLHECGTILADEEGLLLPGMEAVRSEATRAARGLMAGEVLDGRLCLSCFIEVKDEGGAVVLAIPFKDVVEISDYSEQ